MLDFRQYQYVEVKYREQIAPGKFKFAMKLAKKSGNKLIVVTKNDFAVQGDLKLIPVWMLKN